MLRHMIRAGVARWGGLFLNGAALRDPTAVIALAQASAITGGRGAAYTLSGAISGAFGLTYAADAGTVVTLAAVNTYSGGTIVNGGTLRFSGAGTTAPAGAITVNSGAALVFARHDTWGSENTASSAPVTVNAGGMLQSGGFFNALWNLTLNGGTVALTGGANATYGTFLLAGTLTATGAAAVNVVSGTNNQISIGGFGNLTLTVATPASGDTLTIAAVLKNSTIGAGALAKTGTGALTLSGLNTYTGGTTISGGRIISASTAPLGTGALTFTANAQLSSANGGGLVTNAIVVNTGVTATMLAGTDGTVNLQLGGAISGAGSINHSDGYNLVLTGDMSAFTGTISAVAFNWSSLSFQQANLSMPSGRLTVNNASISMTGNAVIGHLAGVAASTTPLVIGANKTLTFGGLNLGSTITNPITGAGAALVKTGTGSYTLSGNSTYSGGTTINGGTLVAGHVNAFGTGTITVNAGATLNRAGFAIANTIVNNGGTVI